ncbi:MAG: hypothetical protein AAGA56_24050 [Myxococcota bacterium]
MQPRRVGLSLPVGAIIDAKKELERARGPLSRCYAEQLNREPVEGDVTLDLSVDPLGMVTSVNQQAPPGFDGAFKGCLTMVAASLWFEAPVGGGPSRVVVTIHFVPEPTAPEPLRASSFDRIGTKKRRALEEGRRATR